MKTVLNFRGYRRKRLTAIVFQGGGTDVRRDRQKRLAFLICAALAAATLFSMLFIVRAAVHDCSGKDCPVCVCIRQIEQTFRKISASPAETPLFLFALILSFMVPVGTFSDIPSVTLVSRKVRLDN